MAHNFQLGLVVLLAAAVVFLFRILFSSRDSSREQMSSTHRQMTGGDHSGSLHAFGSPPSARGNLGTAPIASHLSRVTVAQSNFVHFDAIAGPPDPDHFCDELILELYDSVSDFRWTTTYVVATPSGIRRLMDEERWSFFYATEIFVVRRYEFETIRAAVYGRVQEVHDQVTRDAEGPPAAG